MLCNTKDEPKDKLVILLWKSFFALCFLLKKDKIRTADVEVNLL